MLNFLKGTVQEYTQLLATKPEYGSDLFLDTELNRLYINGNPLDTRVEVIESKDENMLLHKTYKFINAEGATVSIEDVKIPELVNGEVVIRDMEQGVDFPYNNGFMTVEDKIMVEGIADILGVYFEFNYYAAVNHIRTQYQDHDFETLTDVDVYQDNGQWFYDYDQFEYVQELPGGRTQIAKYPQDSLVGTEPVDAEKIQVKTVIIKRKPQDIVLFDGGGLSDETTMVVDHGGIPAGTKVSDLKEFTVSQIISKVLFQQAHPEKISDTVAYLKYKETYAPDGIVEVGYRYPEVEDFEVVFIPETWQMFSNVTGEPVGEPFYTTQFDHADYWLMDYEHPHEGGHRPGDDLYNLVTDAEYYADHTQRYKVEFGDKCVYWADVYYTAIGPVVDSMGNTSYIDKDGNEVVIVQPTDGQIKTNDLLYDNDNQTVDEDGNVIAESPVWVSWEIFSNASETSSESLWLNRFEEPVAFRGNEAIINSRIITKDQGVAYLKWPSVLTAENKLFVYIPNAFELADIGGANDFTPETFNIELAAKTVNTVVEETDPDTGEIIEVETDTPIIVNIENSLGKEGEFNKYIIERQAGITTVKITIRRKA